MYKLSEEQSEYLEMVLWKMLFALKNKTMSDVTRIRFKSDWEYVNDILVDGEYNVNQKTELNRIAHKWKD